MFLWFQSWDFEYNKANSDTIRIAEAATGGAKFTEKQLRQSLFFNKVADMRPEVQVFSCEF